MRVSKIYEHEIRVTALRDAPDSPGAVRITCLVREPDPRKVRVVEAEVTLNVQEARGLAGKVGAALRLLEAGERS